MNIALLGFDSQGQAAYDYWNTPGNNLTICDKNPDITVPEGVSSQLGNGYLQNLSEFDLLVRTPGLHPRDIVAANPETPDILDKVTTVTNEFLRVCPTSNVIGITGTKGKGTTSTLIAKILEADGKRVHLGGNIGVPPLDMLKNDIKPIDWVVLELANFQTIDIKYSPHIGVCLLIIPEHLNWHADFTEYVDAKRQLFIHQESNNILVYNADNHAAIDIARSSNAKKLWYKVPSDSEMALMPEENADKGAYVSNGVVYMGDTEICKTDEIALLGRHNWQNVCAAVAATWFPTGFNVKAMRSVISSFKGLPFRIELRTEKNGVRYYNDSFATAPGAAIAAISSIPGKKVMIMGGFERGLDLSELCEFISTNTDEIRKLIIIGESGPRLAENLANQGFTDFSLTDSKHMDDIVRQATDQAEQGDAVVLSPAFASFDMFKNFEERGKQFNEAVEKL